MAPITATRAGLKNCPAPLTRNTTTYNSAIHTPAGRSCLGNRVTSVSAPTATPRTASVPSMVRLRSHRSTKTPAAGPTTMVAVSAQSSSPLTAAGAQWLSANSTLATQMTSVVSKT
jgi:hypothetical protein